MTVDLVAIPLTVNHLLASSDKTRAAILKESHPSLQVLMDSENASIRAQEVAAACRSAEDSEQTMVL